MPSIGLFIASVFSFDKDVQLEALVGFTCFVSLGKSLDTRSGSLNSLVNKNVEENFNGIIMLRTHIQLNLRVTRLEH